MKGEIYILNNRLNWFDSYASFFEEIAKKINDQQFRGYITVSNVHTVMECYRRREFNNIVEKSYLTIPDGKPLEIVGRLKGQRKIRRLFGPTVLENCLDWGRDHSLKHFFIGSTSQTLEKMKTVIAARYPGTQVVGTIAPPFLPMEEWTDVEFLNQINAAQPDLIWVGLGAPKQEQWMYKNIGRLSKGIMIGVGAGFSYIAGDTKHAPQWMKNASLEWLYRLSQEPSRLWKRYLTTIPPFIVLATMDLARHTVKKNISKTRKSDS